VALPIGVVLENSRTFQALLNGTKEEAIVATNGAAAGHPNPSIILHSDL